MTTLGPVTTALYDLARVVLDSIVAWWPDDAEPLPDLQFVSNGQVAWDGCEFLTTEIQRTFSSEADPALEQIISQGPGVVNRTAIVVASLARCVPMMDTDTDPPIIPSSTETDDSARLILMDAQAMSNAVVTAYLHGDIGGCMSLAVNGWTAATPQGGFGGGSLSIRLQVF